MKIGQVIKYLENFAPSIYQESYDNSGLLVGNKNTEITGILIGLDCLETTIEEAKQQNCNLIITHHPIIFKGLKRLNGNHYTERVVIKALKNDIALYAIHTNLDNVKNGVNFKIAEKLGLKNIKILVPKTQTLMKLTVFVPLENTQNLLQALAEAGAGQIGEYKNCSFQTQGIGHFQPKETANPYIGKANQEESVAENRIEVIFPIHLQHEILNVMQKNHPYEEVAYYLHLLENKNQEIGSGAIGELENEISEKDFLGHLSNTMHAKGIKHTKFLGKNIKKVAVCGGTGSFLLGNAMSQNADVFVSADFKYHEYFEADNKILIADIGHYESEQFTSNLLKDYLLAQKDMILPIFLTTQNTNPVEYFWVE
ncbi:MAG: Nif3-like dinuclear metal center hexameric protein [Bacteroidetes bacterium]|nr:MAG: Nif3-like dinuclear metal center hexameric protein [Bacteroidota bacterium]TAG85602.1 MAG: Nif3-like dinuclear metal center hexameric protein [Bacteroidota bacterium]